MIMAEAKAPPQPPEWLHNHLTAEDPSGESMPLSYQGYQGGAHHWADGSRHVYDTLPKQGFTQNYKKSKSYDRGSHYFEVNHYDHPSGAVIKTTEDKDFGAETVSYRGSRAPRAPKKKV
jgi:hypothetical protein